MKLDEIDLLVNEIRATLLDRGLSAIVTNLDEIRLNSTSTISVRLDFGRRTYWFVADMAAPEIEWIEYAYDYTKYGYWV